MKIIRYSVHKQQMKSSEEACYLSDKRLDAPQRGMNVIKEADGWARKVVVG
ncbi:MAG: hypothetical protein ACTTKM_07610 [Prevotella fusca]